MSFVEGRQQKRNGINNDTHNINKKYAVNSTSFQFTRLKLLEFLRTTHSCGHDDFFLVVTFIIIIIILYCHAK